MFGRFFATFFELLVNSFVASSFILKVKDCYMDIYLCNVQVNAWIMKSYFYPLEDNMSQSNIRILYTDFSCYNFSDAIDNVLRRY